MERLKILDGLRVIAIFMVMLFHYLYLFNGKYYDIAFSEKSYFKYGYLGVQLFFIISGFVITLTLTKSNNFLIFIKKRWIRLFPAMLLCSILTYSIISIFDTKNLFPESKRIINLIISNTFITPSIINPIFEVQTAYIDPPYWSLWVEIQFYTIIGLIYFINKRHFIRHFIILSVGLATLFYLSHDSVILPPKITWFLKVVLEIFNFSQHALWFVFGVLIYKLYFIKKDIKTFILILSIVLLQLTFSNFDFHIILFIIICTFIFYSFLYNQKLLDLLTCSILQKLGIASYSTYLIHQNMGVLLLQKFSVSFGKACFILPIIITLGFSYIGILIYKYFEKPFAKFLVIKLIKK